MSDEKKVGVLGAGSFGTAVANLLAENCRVYLFSRDREKARQAQTRREIRGIRLHPNIQLSDDIEEVTGNCHLLFVLIPSAEFRSLMRRVSPYLHPGHILIHGTKGFDFVNEEQFELKDIKTMSQVMREESNVVRVGVLAGPNLAGELAKMQPAASVVASKFEEVIAEGQKHLSSSRFRVFGSHDMHGIELAGVLKNYIAIASGICSGLGYGENAKALLITRGMGEMIHLGKALGADAKSFLGLAGIGDLMATCSSPLSRNFTVGYRIAQGEKLADILDSMTEPAEGIRTVRVAKKISENYRLNAPIAHVLYRVLFESLPAERGVKFLMRYPTLGDAEYL